jgi:hypothetical protein
MHHHRTITAPSLHHHNTINAPSPHHHNTITTPSPHHQCTITAPSQHHHNTISTPLPLQEVEYNTEISPEQDIAQLLTSRFRDAWAPSLSGITALDELYGPGHGLLSAVDDVGGVGGVLRACFVVCRVAVFLFCYVKGFLSLYLAVLLILITAFLSPCPFTKLPTCNLSTGAPTGTPPTDVDPKKQRGFGAFDGVWKRTGWAKLKAVQRLLRDMTELRDLVNALGKRPVRVAVCVRTVTVWSLSASFLFLSSDRCEVGAQSPLVQSFVSVLIAPQSLRRSCMIILQLLCDRYGTVARLICNRLKSLCSRHATS